MLRSRDERKAVFENTVKIVNKGEYVADSGRTVKIASTQHMIDGTKFYSHKVEVDYDSMPRFKTSIKVVDNDCLKEAKVLIDSGLNPCVLNMASFHTPGGGVTWGSSAQEESIFRRTDIFKSLFRFHEIGEEYGVEQDERQYPLERNYGGIYSPSVTVFRDTEGNDCSLLEEPYEVGIVTLAAIKNPPTASDGKLAPWAEETTLKKIRQILSIAHTNGHDSLVLSAFGCGAYKTPPTAMAELFKEVIFSDEFNGMFKAIHFAIINLASTNGAHNPNGNFEPFAEAFENVE